jgi:DNA mismatch repair ATPase MutS
MLLDPSTIANLELLRNLRTGDAKKSLFGALNHCLTTAGTRCLRSSIIQPSVDLETISARLDCVSELLEREVRARACIRIRMACAPRFRRPVLHAARGEDDRRAMRESHARFPPP